MNIDFTNKKTIGLIVTAAILFIATIGIAIFYFLVPVKQIEVIDFTSMDKVEVDAWILENELTPEQVVFAYEFNEVTEKDTVLNQSILAGETLKKDDILTITLSDGPDPGLIVTIPDFTGKTHDEIETWFKENKFTDITYEYIPDLKIKKDYFIKSNLTEKDVRRNTPIVISISVGEKSEGIEITMPDFADYTKANIQAWAKTNNMKVTFKNETSDKIASGKVISQDPKAGSTTKTGGKVTVNLSIGKGVTATKFDGKTKKDIDTWIKENGLKASYVEVYDNKVANGVVISNKPNSGTIQQGSTVTVNVSIGKPVVENYTNKTKAQYDAYVAGLNKKSANIKTTVVEVESTSAVGTILKQTINGKVVSGSTTVDTGTTVTLEVAKVKSVSVASKAGSSYDDFKKYIEGLGMKLGSKTDRYNDTYNSGIIVSNDTGNKLPGTAINYTQSLGKYSPTVNDFNNIAKDSAQGKINTANNLGAGWTISFSAPEEKAGVAAGSTFDCSIGTKTVTCKVSKGSSITVESKAGSTEADFIAYIKGLGLSPKKTGTAYSDTVAAGSIISNQTGGGFWPGNEISYVLSSGKDPATETATFPNYSLPTLAGSTLDATKDNVKRTLSPFTNIIFQTTSVGIDDPRPSFLVLDISIAPNTANVLLSQQVVVNILVKE